MAFEPIARDAEIGTTDYEALHRDGFTPPASLLHPDESAALLAACGSVRRRQLPWIKSWHALVPEVYETAARPALIDRIEPVLGPDIMLWGTQVIRQPASGRHRWHVDVEHTAWPGVTVWLCLQNAAGRSGMSFVTGSHQVPMTPQELGRRHGVDLDSDRAVLEAAQRLRPGCELVEFDVQAGHFVIFLGRTWHASRNLTTSPRVSLICQYAHPEVHVRIPTSFNPPNVTWAATSPACALVRGRDRAGTNVLIDRDKIGAQGAFPRRPRVRQYVDRLVGEAMGWARNQLDRVRSS